MPKAFLSAAPTSIYRALASLRAWVGEGASGSFTCRQLYGGSYLHAHPKLGLGGKYLGGKFVADRFNADGVYVKTYPLSPMPRRTRHG